MSEVRDYEMFTTAGNRLIHNRVETVRKNVAKITETGYDGRVKIEAAIAKGIKGYSNMHSEKHIECHDTEPRNHFLHAMERIYMDATGCDKTEAFNVVDQVYYNHG